MLRGARKLHLYLDPNSLVAITHQLPEVFTKDDIMKIFGYTNRNVAYTKIKRLIEQNLVEDIDGEENKGKYRKRQEIV